MFSTFNSQRMKDDYFNLSESLAKFCTSLQDDTFCKYYNCSMKQLGMRICKESDNWEVINIMN